MSQLKVNAISDAAGASGNAITLATDGTCTTKATNKADHNFIYNGEMQINQRGTKAAINGYGGPDRWKTSVSQAVFTASQDSEAPPGFKSSLKLDCTTAATLTANNSIQIAQHLEGLDLQGLAAGTSSAKSLTLSFWVRSTKTGVFNTHIYQKDGGKLVSQNTTISSANTWEKKTFTVSGNTADVIANDNTKSLTIEFWLDSGPDNKGGTITDSWAASASNKYGQGITLNIGDNTSNDFYLTGVQLELGDFASDYAYRSYGEELRRCERYFQLLLHPDDATEDIGTGFASSGTEVQFPLGQFRTTMRANPTIWQTTGTEYFKIGGGSYGGDKWLSNSWNINSISKVSGALYTAPDANLSSLVSAQGLIQAKSTSARLGLQSEL